ncbi:MAG TPA: PilZ domain-containing protein [Candidatus Saccharimonadales bacterium]|nr:PilZ domain-containing protein [Candidatus Saccharimonadales bacterium]
MPDVTVERRSAPRYPMVLSADVVELPRGARLSARTSDISLTGCYIDTLNPIPQGSEIRLRISHNNEIFEAVGRVVYVSYGLGMGVVFTKMTEDERARLVRWLENREQEF